RAGRSLLRHDWLKGSAGAAATDLPHQQPRRAARERRDRGRRHQVHTDLALGTNVETPVASEGELGAAAPVAHLDHRRSVAGLFYSPCEPGLLPDVLGAAELHIEGAASVAPHAFPENAPSFARVHVAAWAGRIVKQGLRGQALTIALDPHSGARVATATQQLGAQHAGPRRHRSAVRAELLPRAAAGYLHGSLGGSGLGARRLGSDESEKEEGDSPGLT